MAPGKDVQISFERIAINKKYQGPFYKGDKKINLKGGVS